ncbi:hypothetical protein ACFOLJ_31040 [Rugamonas sp. CCM 8940]|uniref:hypothetical protein n=1 Tax=Rugamonas sp. CCM 8940 TaxID=2765359 RepID=UPI0018F79AAA|nr:hypothetical protein [Rugamonas sp. CCM 8940]MBJ7309210.1 hypothetical protein [Rugamonas sp. CCM 8940]
MLPSTRRAALLLLAAIALPPALSGCATDLNSNTTLALGPKADFDSADLVSSTTEQTKILAQLQIRAGLPPPPEAITTDAWDKVIDAGIEYADSKCEAYMAALVRLNRDRKTVSGELGLLGTASAGIMAAAKSAAKDVSLVAIAFGLSAATVDNLSNNVLYDIEPSSVRALVKALQAKYKDEKVSGYTSRPAAMAVIRGYASLCIPASIEAEVNHAVKNAQPGGKAGNAATGRAPEVSNARVTVDASFAPDASSKLLNQFVKQNGAIDNERRSRLEAFMRAKGIGVSYIAFINTPAYAQDRVEAVLFFNLAK